MTIEVEQLAADKKPLDSAEERAPRQNETDIRTLEDATTVSEKLTALSLKFVELEAKFVELAASAAAKNSASDSEDAKDSKKGEDDSEKSRIKVLVVKIDNNGIWTEVKVNAKTVPQKDDPVVILRRFPNAEGWGELQIQSQGLLSLLKRLLAHYPAHYFSGDSARLETPFEVLIHNWDSLYDEARKTTTDPEDIQIREDLHGMLDAISSGSGQPKLDRYLRSRQELIKQKCITFETLWTLFPPGTIVHSQLFLKNDPSLSEQIFVVGDDLLTWPEEGEDRKSTWDIKGWTYDYDGERFGWREIVLRIDRFEGQQPITSLSTYPLEYMEPDKRISLKERLIRRGERFRSFCLTSKEHKMYDYTGDAIFEQQGFRMPSSVAEDADDRASVRNGQSGRAGRRSAYKKRHSIVPLVKSDIMIDFKSYYRYGPNEFRVGEATLTDNLSLLPDSIRVAEVRGFYKPHQSGHSDQLGDQWEELQRLLCPPRVLGYVLKDKQWAQLAVDSLYEIEAARPETVLAQLHLAKGTKGKESKELLLQLVQNHGKDGGVIEDLVAEKGKGLVFLLYGEPGVGKTSTAQIIARAAKKPLFQISAADVGTEAREVELNLDSIFDLATTWGAILLIDEADVFLQSRSRGQLGPSAEGSALVSVFLKLLEYYRGIMFLTTNQIAQFDVAVQSRVHLALKYDKLDDEQTQKIFLGCVKQWQRAGKVDQSDLVRIEEYGENELHQKGFDGRQIRNIVNCAMGFANKENENLTDRHVRLVIRYVEAFSKDLAGQRQSWRDMQDRTRL